MAVSTKTFLLCLGIFLLSLVHNTSTQNDLYVDAGGKRFTIYTVNRNWFQANAACVAAGMSLASIETADEHSALRKYLISSELFGNSFWLSGTSLDEYDNSEFTWLSSGNKLSYAQWKSGQPDTSIKGACIYTDAQFKWVNVMCSTLDTKYYICARPLVPDCGITGRCKRSGSFY